MANMLRNGVSWLAGVQKTSGSDPVTLHRGAQSTAGVAAVFAETTAIVDEGNGGTSTVKSADFLILVTDYVIGGQAVEPASGDLIRYGGDYYQVLPFAGEPHERYSDPFHTRYRIHTKQIEAPEDSGDPAYSEAFLRGLLEIDNTNG
jgi:hypothetical protein